MVFSPKEILIAGLKKGVEIGYDFRVNFIGYEEDLNQIKNPNIPLLIYFNHISADDPIIAPWIVGKIFSERLPDIVMPVSNEYMNFFKKWYYALGVRLIAQGLLGWQMPQIVQSYRLRDERLSEDERRELQGKSFGLARNFLTEFKNSLENKQKQPVIILFPEGHRSREGLLPAEEGAGLIVKELSKTNKGLILPIGLVYEDDQRDGFNFNLFKPPKIDFIIGNPLIPEQVINEAQIIYESYGIKFNRGVAQLSHGLMWILSQILPEAQRGYYSKDRIRETLSDVYKIGINIRGKSFVIKKNNPFPIIKD